MCLFSTGHTLVVHTALAPGPTRNPILDPGSPPSPSHSNPIPSPAHVLAPGSPVLTPTPLCLAPRASLKSGLSRNPEATPKRSLSARSPRVAPRPPQRMETERAMSASKSPSPQEDNHKSKYPAMHSVSRSPSCSKSFSCSRSRLTSKNVIALVLVGSMEDGFKIIYKSNAVFQFAPL